MVAEVSAVMLKSEFIKMEVNLIFWENHCLSYFEIHQRWWYAYQWVYWMNYSIGDCLNPSRRIICENFTCRRYVATEPSIWAHLLWRVHYQRLSWYFSIVNNTNSFFDVEPVLSPTFTVNIWFDKVTQEVCYCCCCCISRRRLCAMFNLVCLLFFEGLP